MTDYKYDFLVFIGRFQPFHKGHLAVVEEALEKAERLIIILGSANQPRNSRNPFTTDERSKMIYGSLSEEHRDRVICTPMQDFDYNDAKWERAVQQTVNSVIAVYGPKDSWNCKIGLIGREKDHTSYYLKKFPQWESENVVDFYNLSATPIRYEFFERRYISDVPEGTYRFLTEFSRRPEWDVIHNEIIENVKYQRQWANSPFPPIFVTVDAVVIQSAHVLLVKRGGYPGKGLLALPGGFLNQEERLEEAMLRELTEETQVDVPLSVLKGNIKSSRVFDAPMRSTRGRTITHGYLIQLPDQENLPKVIGSDDADEAFWVPLSLITPENMFEDHYSIINILLGYAE